MPDVYYYRALGQKYCKTDGSSHYRVGEVEPLDLIVARGYAQHHILASIIKYASRFPHKQHLDDLRKIADYAHILCGLTLAEKEDEPCSTSDTETLK